MSGWVQQCLHQHCQLRFSTSMVFVGFSLFKLQMMCCSAAHACAQSLTMIINHGDCLSDNRSICSQALNR